LVEQFPTATFASTRLEPIASDSATHTVTGDLTLRGVTKSVAFPATISRAGDNVSVKSEFAINRKDFGIAYAGKPDDLIRDDVVIQLDLQAKG
jgi:polyisoprenoid-binding protein YceI